MNSSSESHTRDAADNAEQDEDESVENAEPSDDDVIQNYRIRPQLEEKFKPNLTKEIIHNILFDQLSAKVYDQVEAQAWCREIADLIRNKIKASGLFENKYKLIVNVVLGEKNGSGVKIGTRCIWDAEADNYAHDSFTNDSLFCVATVYAIFRY